LTIDLSTALFREALGPEQLEQYYFIFKAGMEIRKSLHPAFFSLG